MKIGFYAGSFDPFTTGHLHIAKQASAVFDKIIIGIGVNESKTRRFNQHKMKDAITKLIESENINAECVIYDGLTTDVAKELGATFLIRGLRNSSDYASEENLAVINKEISGINTIFFRAGEFGAVSSTMVMELIKRNKDVSKYVPPFVIDIIK